MRMKFEVVAMVLSAATVKLSVAIVGTVRSTNVSTLIFFMVKTESV